MLKANFFQKIHFRKSEYPLFCQLFGAFLNDYFSSRTAFGRPKSYGYSRSGMLPHFGGRICITFGLCNDIVEYICCYTLEVESASHLDLAICTVENICCCTFGVDSASSLDLAICKLEKKYCRTFGVESESSLDFSIQ